MATLIEPTRRPEALVEVRGTSPFAYVGPNWFASVMGTGIVSIALVGLPIAVPGARLLATAFWLLASALLVGVSAATVAHHWRYPVTARGHLDHPVMAHFYGAPAMAFLTIGAATLLVGPDVIGEPAALMVDAVLWTTGTVFGLVTTVLVPLRAMTVHDNAPGSAFGGWLMPVVPPMVTATTGALLVPHLPAGQARGTMLVFCGLCFGVSLVASLLVIGQIWGRLAHHGIGAAAMAPTYWIVLGPIGQSITAVHHLGGVTPLDATTGRTLVLGYGVPMLGFALAWLALAVAITVRTAREHLPFSLTWWSFTFPVGTVVTGAEGLGALTGLVALQALAVVLLVGLLIAWAVVAVRTARGVWDGSLLRAPAVS